MDRSTPLTSTNDAPEDQAPVQPEEAPDWKAQARKWERRAKANSDAAAKLADASKRVADLEGALKDANARADAITQALDIAAGDPALAKLLLARDTASAADYAQMLRDFAAAPARPVVAAIGKRGAPAAQETTAAFVRRLFS